MAFFSKNAPEPIPEVETKIWSCTSDDCTGWMREKFSLNKEPNCPLCDATMTPGVRVLPDI